MIYVLECRCQFIGRSSSYVTTLVVDSALNEAEAMSYAHDYFPTLVEIISCKPVLNVYFTE